ncbi:hypothetical protein F4859DRAFT_524217 [Xylaria cf. heliscus]|nr:hypothetical protein F4859DRAFT_524217 [Xylaria cf. heliscus]
MEPQTGPVDENRVSRIFHEIQTIYDSGTPIFTKDNIRKLGEELQRFQNGERNSGNIVLNGVNGVDYEVFVKPPIDRPPRENEHLGGSKWVINYRSIKTLTTRIHVDYFDFQSAYLPMQICAPIRLLSNSPEYKKPPAPPAEDLEMFATIEIPCSLTKVIALALGPLVLKSQISERHVVQHALVSAIHSILIQRGILSMSSKQHVQDPAYTQRDRGILHSAGSTVLEDPQAWLELDENSVLICINSSLPVRDIVADICCPGIIIWDRGGRSSPLNLRGTKMMEDEYCEIGFLDHECFGDLVVLVRKST